MKTGYDSARSNGEMSPPGKSLLLRLVVPGRIPSWNQLLGLSHWRRLKLKKAQQQAFISSLHLSENASATRIISRKNGLSIVSDIVALFQEMSRNCSPSKPGKGKRNRKNKSTPRS